MSHKTEFQHLGVVLDSLNRDAVTVEAHMHIQFFGAASEWCSILAWCQNDDVWMKIVEAKLFPVLSFGSHLWSIEKSGTGITRMVNTAYRKGV